MRKRSDNLSLLFLKNLHENIQARGVRIQRIREAHKRERREVRVGVQLPTERAEIQEEPDQGREHRDRVQPVAGREAVGRTKQRKEAGMGVHLWSGEAAKDSV